MQHHRHAFTLIELLVVIVIIALLSSLVAPKFFGKLDNAKVKTTKAQLEMIATALDAFRLDVGRYPSTDEGLAILWAKNSDVKGWSGPYLPKKVPADAWEHPYMYKFPGNNGEDYELLSYGADGAEGGEDDRADLSVWE
ncbi:MAG: type II secretion system major pseudopilin GspG [Campylobacterales bacterium]|nr:type II secretion system major pseudopilin GspG [Campylobacterales bacterium]